MRCWVVALAVAWLGLAGCERQAVEGRAASAVVPSDAAGVMARATGADAFAERAGGPHDLARAVYAGRTDGFASVDAGGLAAGDLASVGSPATEPSGAEERVLKQSTVSADFLVMELDENATIKRLSAVTGAHALVRCSESVLHEAGQADTDCDSHLLVASDELAESVLADTGKDVPGITCLGEERETCFSTADVSISLLALPGLPGGMIVVTGFESKDHVWERESKTESAVFALVRRGTLAPLELRKVLAFDSSTHRETTREDHPEMTRREKAKEPTHTEENAHTELAVVKKGKRSLPELWATTRTEHLTQFESRPDKKSSSTERARYVFDGIGYVSNDTALNTAAHCGSLTKHCATDEDCCSGACQKLNTTSHCGSCSVACVGDKSTSSESACVDPKSGRCWFGCLGAHYDVDGRLDNGCEQLDSTETVTDLGAVGCFDQTLLWRGVLLADAREHRSPVVTGWDAKTGSVPRQARVQATGGLLCLNDFALTVSTRGGTKEACYRLQIDGLAAPQTLSLTGIDDKKLVLPRRAYISGRQIVLRLEKTCAGAVALQFSLAFHL